MEPNYGKIISLNGNPVATTTANDLVIVYDENLINVSCDDSSWVVDSGSSFHVTVSMW